MSAEPTHYELLGVASDAPKDDIRAAYQDKLADVREHRAHEEESKRPSESVIQAARDEEGRLRAAWQVLSDPVQRQRYDDLVGLVPTSNGDGVDLADDHHDDDEDGDDTVDAAQAPDALRMKPASMSRSSPVSSLRTRAPVTASPVRCRSITRW